MSEGEIRPIVPKTGQLLIENPEELILCKPRLIPLKSYTLEKLEKMQEEAIKTLKESKQKTEDQ